MAFICLLKRMKHPYEKHLNHSDNNLSLHHPRMGSERSSMFQTSLGGVLAPFHAQEKLLTSSSWVDQVPNFRQEIRQSHYRNDPVKYDLS